jgi:outer membrane murein-binding lipoprotein Lpp
MSDDLVKRLRVDVFYGDERFHNLSRHNPLHMEAANRIEELDDIIRHDRERIEELVSMVDSKDARIEELEADLRKMALDYLAAQGQAAEAYQAQLEAEAKLANIAHAVWTEHKDWEGERKYALRQIVKWLVRAGQD